MKKTKIISTLGPSSENEQIIEKMLLSGTDIVRLNFSHATYRQHKDRAGIVHRTAKKLDIPVGILIDLQGPKIRISELPTSCQQKSVELKQNENFVLKTNYTELYKYLNKNDKIFVDDGKVELKVKKIVSGKILCEVQTAGTISLRKGVIIPNKILPLPVVTEQDKNDLNYAVKQRTLDINYVAVSFTRMKENILQIKKILKKLHSNHISIIAKIEDHQGVENIDSIIDVSDGIMIARGDMGVCLPGKEVPLIQKRIIKKCSSAGVPVIVATQMLDSMTTNLHPTRAEVSDVANAILDGADCLMLSGETAQGQYPVESVEQMKQIIESVESSNEFKNFITQSTFYPDNPTLVQSIAIAVDKLSETIELKAIVSKSEGLAKVVSQYRPHIPIIAVISDKNMAKKLILYWGVQISTIKKLLQKKLIHKGDKVIFIDKPIQKPFYTNIRILEV